MNKSERAIAVKKILDKTYPETPVPLHHKDNFSLLVAVLLSAPVSYTHLTLPTK